MIPTELNMYNLSNSIASKVNEEIKNLKDDLRNQSIQELKKYLEPLPTHYEWQESGQCHNTANCLIEKGKISLNLTVYEFLDGEYTGEAEPIREFGRRPSYYVFGDKFSTFINNLCEDILYNITREYIEENLGYPLITTDFDEIMANYHDDIYEYTLVADFCMCYEEALRFLEIKDIKLNQLVCF